MRPRCRGVSGECCWAPPPWWPAPPAPPHPRALLSLCFPVLSFLFHSSCPHLLCHLLLTTGGLYPTTPLHDNLKCQGLLSRSPPPPHPARKGAVAGVGGAPGTHPGGWSHPLLPANSGNCCWHTSAWLQATSLSDLSVPTGRARVWRRGPCAHQLLTPLQHLGSSAIFSTEGARGAWLPRRCPQAGAPWTKDRPRPWRVTLIC